ncbi:hypothetical protein E2C01_039692 [Portunus trituberculatus]|uniref:Uncharacterized protein n=1 Tax=Portunus trituberculatus TaxID=210409 RepID=A0A5B7FKH3_PORTR|nr:hypothetical protein [Portunus trituberculatus]
MTIGIWKVIEDKHARWTKEMKGRRRSRWSSAIIVIHLLIELEKFFDVEMGMRKKKLSIRNNILGQETLETRERLDRPERVPVSATDKNDPRQFQRVPQTIMTLTSASDQSH